MTFKLPIHEVLNQALAAVQKYPVVIIDAPPGSGKTTVLPLALTTQLGLRVAVLEPRRVAARLAANFAATLNGDPVGTTVGFEVRFDRSISDKTKLTFLTEGLLIRRLQGNPRLEDFDVVILDEFHERHIHTDVALAMLCHLQKTSRPDLRIVIMSATLEVERLNSLFKDVGRISTPSTRFQTLIQYCPIAQENGLASIAEKVASIVRTPPAPGDVLVFLPGAREIEWVVDRLRQKVSAQDLLVLPFYAALPQDRQDIVFRSSNIRKCIVSTNIAESSITIPGVRIVVDSGLAKIASHAHWSGISVLQTKPISQASCEQRSGRAGREGPGFVYRMFSEQEFLQRKKFEVPEIQRLDLMQTILEIALILGRQGSPRINAEFLNSMAWLDKPPAALVDQALQTLRLLGAIDDSQQLTPLGTRMAALPLHPRLGRIVCHGLDQHCSVIASLAAISVQEGLLNESRDISIFDQFTANIENLFNSLVARSGHTPNDRFGKMWLQLESFLPKEQRKKLLDQDDWYGLSQALLYGFPERVARRRAISQEREIEYTLTEGGSVFVKARSDTASPEWIIVVDAEETNDKIRGRFTKVQMAFPFDVENLITGSDHFLHESEEIAWDDAHRCVRSFKRLYYGQLIVEERRIKSETEKSSALLLQYLRKLWPQPFSDDEPWMRYKLKHDLAKRLNIQVGKAMHAGELATFQEWICAQKTSFEELLEQSLGKWIEDYFGEEHQRILQSHFPDELRLGSGRMAKIHYENGKEPWLESRLQNFFGSESVPRIAEGALSITLHLLAPNHRAVQITSDLSSFWKNSYPKVRQELMRRYPRHAWPEDPIHAKPSGPTPRRR